jgi:hypothetical protein
MKKQPHLLTLAITCLFSLAAFSQTQSDPLGPEQGVTPLQPRKALAAPLDEKIEREQESPLPKQQQSAPREQGSILVNDESSAIKMIAPKPPVDESLSPEGPKTAEPVKPLRIRKKAG